MTRTLTKKQRPSSTEKIENGALKFVPETYQQRVIKFMVSRPCAGIFLDPGLGKTGCTLSAFRILKKAKQVRTMLVIAPLIICHNVWPNEINKFDEFRNFKHVVLHGKNKEEDLYSGADIFIINPEGLEWLSEMMRRDPSLRRKFNMLAVDESTKFKHTKTKRFQVLKSMLPYFARRYILSGTPAANSLENLFAQIYILDEGRALGRYITHFRNKYFYPGGYMNYQWFPQPDAEKLIYEQLKDLAIRMEAADYLKLPPIIYKDVVIDLPDKARKLYDEMENDLITKIDRHEIVALSGGAATQKLRQIANGGVYTDPAEHKAKVVHMAKSEMCESIVEELNGKPAIIVFEFHHDLERLLETFGNKTPYVVGGMKQDDIKEIERAWNRGEVPVLLAQMSCISHGLNLQEKGRAIIWHSNTYDYEIYDQLIKRLWRKGQKHNVFIYHIMVRSSVDFIMKYARTRKGNAQKSLLDCFKEDVAKRRKAA